MPVDLFSCVQDVLVNTTGQRYIVVDMLGAGTFGQVVSTYSEAESKQVAVKVGRAQASRLGGWVGRNSSIAFQGLRQ